MCGIAGFFSRKQHSKDLLRAMIGQIRHRGPDGFGTYIDDHVGLAHARLSIIDLSPDGFQPIHNEDKTVWVSFNGEIFNYVELRKDLIQKGHQFYTNTDTEVIVHMYEEYGNNFVQYLNGQFAIALYDKKNRKALLIRDRMGIRPLYYTQDTQGAICFASEIKSLLVNENVNRKIDLHSLTEIFSLWSCIQPMTPFENISQIPEGHYMSYNIDTQSSSLHCYWDHNYEINDSITLESAVSMFNVAFNDAVKLRLRADVPVGAYLSGGLDSTAIVRSIIDTANPKLRTFSIGFEDGEFDENSYQRDAIEMFGVDHTEFKCSYQDIVDNFEQVIYHTESPILRTAPIPMFILSKMVKDSGYSVVLTGEGADEALGGYDLFRETRLRRALMRGSDKSVISKMLQELYSWRDDIVKLERYAKTFFDMKDTEDNPTFSHTPRWKTTSRSLKFFKDNSRFNGMDVNRYYNLLSLFKHKDVPSSDIDRITQAQYTEYHTLLSGYLLSSQGDRVSAANAIEGRYPFIDHRFVNFCNTLPIDLKIKFMNEKYLLKEAMKGKIPESILSRKKQPYMAPDGKALFSTKNNLLDYISKEKVDSLGLFDYNKLQLLINKFRKGKSCSFPDNMSLIGVVSAHILYDKFIDNFEIKSSPSSNETFVDVEE